MIRKIEIALLTMLGVPALCQAATDTNVTNAITSLQTDALAYAALALTAMVAVMLFMLGFRAARFVFKKIVGAMK